MDAVQKKQLYRDWKKQNKNLSNFSQTQIGYLSGPEGDEA